MFAGVRGNAVQDIPVFWAQRKIPVDLHFIVRLLLRLEDVASVAPSIKVKILHLSTLYGHACFSLSFPCGRTMFECILVLSYILAVSFSWVSPESRIDAPPAVPYFCFPA